MHIEELENKLELRGYFFDYLSRLFVVGFYQIYKYSESDKRKFADQLQEAYNLLSNKLQETTGLEDVDGIISESYAFYMSDSANISEASKSIGPNLN